MIARKNSSTSSSSKEGRVGRSLGEMTGGKKWWVSEGTICLPPQAYASTPPSGLPGLGNLNILRYFVLRYILML